MGFKKETMKTKLIVFERKVLRKIFGPTKEEDGTWRIKTNDELDKFIRHKNIINYIKSTKVKLVWLFTRCGNKETGLLLLLISGHVDDEEEGRALTRGLPSTVTQRFIHAHRLVWP